MRYFIHNGRIAPTLFGIDDAIIGAGLGTAGSIFGGAPKQTHLDDSAVRQQLQAKQIAAQQQEGAAARTQQAVGVSLQAQDEAARKRVEALDRIIGTFQQNLRIR